MMIWIFCMSDSTRYSVHAGPRGTGGMKLLAPCVMVTTWSPLSVTLCAGLRMLRLRYGQWIQSL